jgi:hypothetical protein
VIEMRSREYDTRRADLIEIGTPWRGTLPSATVAPMSHVAIEPPPVAQAKQRGAVRSLTSLASAFGAAEADDTAELIPVNRIEPT